MLLTLLASTPQTQGESMFQRRKSFLSVKHFSGTIHEKQFLRTINGKTLFQEQFMRNTFKNNSWQTSLQEQFMTKHFSRTIHEDEIFQRNHLLWWLGLAAKVLVIPFTCVSSIRLFWATSELHLHVFQTRYNNLSLTSDLHELDKWRRATGWHWGAACFTSFSFASSLRE